ncbi:MAG: PPA1309 family protein [Nocardioidaceae bacterium]
MTPDPLVAAGLRAAVVEVELDASEAGWDRPARLFALVGTMDLVEAEPALAAELGASDGEASAFTAVEQELAEHAGSLEELLSQITWPDAVAGALAVVERVVLPPEAEAAVPDDPAEAARYAAGHQRREEVRIVAGVLRSGESHCALRMRSHDVDDEVLNGADLVPRLVQALRETLEA